MESVGVQEVEALVLDAAGAQRQRQQLGQAPVQLDRSDIGPRLEQAQGEGAQARTDLEHGLARFHPGTADDGADGVGIHHEVLPALLRGTDPCGLGEFPDVTGSQQHPCAGGHSAGGIDAGGIDAGGIGAGGLAADGLRAGGFCAGHAATTSGQRYTSWVVARIVRQACSRSVPVTSAIVAMVCGIR